MSEREYQNDNMNIKLRTLSGVLMLVELLSAVLVMSAYRSVLNVNQSNYENIRLACATTRSDNNGRIEIPSKPGGGTCFTLWLPLQRKAGQQSGVSA